MDLNYNEKFLRCIEWSICIPNESSTLLSDSFKIQDLDCKLKFCVQISWDIKYVCCLMCNGQLDSPVKIILRVNSIFNNYSLEVHTITGEEQEIWKYRSDGFFGHFLSFDIIILENFPKEKQTITMTTAHPEQEVKEIKANSHLEALSRDFSKLLDDSSSSDVKIECEGKTFNAHSLVIGTRSVVFSAMLKNNMVERKAGSIKIDDVEASIFQKFLRYLYTGAVPDMDTDTSVKFYEVNDKYDVKELKQTCSDFLSKNLNSDNACEMLVIADRHSDKDFRKNIISHIIDKRVPQLDGRWCDFCKNYPILALEVQNLYIQKYCPK